jgi:hypothetical protein
MGKWIFLAVACCLLLSVGTCGAGAKYEATWESLDRRATPRWWVDAKFGIFIHWGVYSVPAWSVPGQYSEWYWRRVEGGKAKYDIAELTGPPTGDKAVIEAFFTAKGETLYVITPRWPGRQLTVKDIEVSSNTDVTMLGLAQSLSWGRSGSGLTIEVPPLSVDEVPCKYAYVFRITHVK